MVYWLGMEFKTYYMFQVSINSGQIVELERSSFGWVKSNRLVNGTIFESSLPSDSIGGNTLMFVIKGQKCTKDEYNQELRRIQFNESIMEALKK